MSGTPPGSPSSGPAPLTSSLRLKLGSIRLPDEGSLEDILAQPPPAFPVTPSATAHRGRLRLRLKPSRATEATTEEQGTPPAAAAAPATVEVDVLPSAPVNKAHRPEAAANAASAFLPAAKAPSTNPVARNQLDEANAAAALGGAAGSSRPVRRPPPPPFPSAPQPPGAAPLQQPTTPGANAPAGPTFGLRPTPPGGDKRPTPKVASLGLGKSRAPVVDAGPPIVPLTKVKVPLIKDELAKYDIQRKVGEGTYGEVYLARERQSGHPVAIKKLKVLEQMEGLPNTTLREITILQSLKAFNECKHFAALREVTMAPDYRSLHLVFEFIEHSLYGLMVQGVRFTEADYRCVFRQVLRGLAVLHEAHIVHRDIKPNNILVDNAGNVKLCDFGLAFSTTAGRNRITPRLVALAYRPPEMLLNASSYSSAVDVWSVGCMLAQVYLGGSPPFMRNATQPADSEIEQLALVGAACGLRAEHVSTLIGIVPEGVEVAQPPPSPVHLPVFSEQHLSSRLERHIVTMARDRKQPPIPKPVLNIICKALTLDPAHRPSCRELLRSGWFMNSVNETVERAAMARRIREAIGDRFCHTAASSKC